MNTNLSMRSSEATLTLAQALKVSALSDNIPSPCLSVCRIVDAERLLCEGCWRTIDEIAGWSHMGSPEKKIVWALIEQRIAATPHGVKLDPASPETAPP